MLIPLGVIFLIALAMPAVGLYVNEYRFVEEFPYGSYYHTTITYGTRTFQLLGAVGFLGLLFGCIDPRTAIWFGRKDRLRVVIIYGFVFATAALVRSETTYLSKYVFFDEQGSMTRTYEQLSTGMSSHDVVAQAKQIDANISFHYGDTSSYYEVAGFPYRTPQPAIVIKFPSYYPKFESQHQIVVEMSKQPRNNEAVSTRVTLIQGGAMLSIKPPLSQTEPRIYKGHIVPGTTKDSFVACGTKERFELKDPQKASRFPNYSKIAPLRQGEQIFSVFSAIPSQPETKRLGTQHAGILEVLQLSRQGSKKNIDKELMMATDANGLEQPWDCVY